MKNTAKNVVQYYKAFCLSAYGQIARDFQTGPCHIYKNPLSAHLYRVPSNQLRKKSLTFPGFSMRLFPDFSWVRGTYFTLKCRGQWGDKILANIWFAEKVHLNHGWNLVYFSQRKIPWLSLTLNKIPWLARRNFPPDSPWFSLMLGTLVFNLRIVSWIPVGPCTA